MARAVAVTSLLRLGFRLTSSPPVSTFSPIATSHSVSSNWCRGEQFRHLQVPVLNVHIIRRQQQRLWRCMSSGSAHEDSGHMPARLVQKQKELDALPEYEDLDQPIPKISLEHVTMSFARSGGAGGQNVNKVNTKVDMRFKVMAADWLPERVKLKLLQMEKNRINSEGELVMSSTRTRTQKGNIEDALSKIQECIDAASYVPPPPSEEKLKRIKKLAKIDNERRLTDKKRAGSKKTERRNKGSWD